MNTSSRKSLIALLAALLALPFLVFMYRLVQDLVVWAGIAIATIIVVLYLLLRTFPVGRQH
jgi:hypothetical protein